VESYISTFRTPITADQSTSALRRLAPAIRVAHDSDDPGAHLEMLVGAYEAGLALNASVVLGHSLAYTIAARTHLSHGVTCAMTLPYCLAYCRPASEDSIAALGTSLAMDAVADDVVDWIINLVADLGIPRSLSDVGLTRRDLPEMARECVERYRRPNNPVPITTDALMPLLERFLAGDARQAWNTASAAQ
jgi:alcohol dehydrogenase class IV